MYQFSDVKSLQTLFDELLKLKELVKCPICLDVVKSPVQVRCRHTFCADCLREFQDASAGRNVQCPLCRKTVSAKKSTNQSVEHLAKFMGAVSEKLRAVFDCEGLDVRTGTAVTSKLKKRSREDPLPANRNAASTSINSTATAARISEEFPLYKGHSSSSHDVHSSAQDDTFNQFLQSTVPMRYKNIRTYDRKKESIAPVVTYNKLIGFENDCNKMKIIHWLTDSRNCFDRLTQTQQDSFEPGSAHRFDFSSISQGDRLHLKTYTESLDNIRKSRAKLAGKSRHERRARSLEFAIGSYTKSPAFKRHSLACETPDFEEARIEEVESQSDINDVMHLMEEDCLNALEMDMDLPRESEHTAAKGDLLTGKSTGWSRIKQIKRAINKKERKPKKLDVSFTPTCSGSKAKIKSTEKKAVVLLSRLLTDELGRLKSDGNVTDVNKVYNLNEIESYIEGNILKCRNATPENVSDDNENKFKEPSCDYVRQKPDVITRDSNVVKAKNDLIKELPRIDDVEPNTSALDEKSALKNDDLFMQSTQVINLDEEQVADDIEEKLEIMFNTQPEKDTRGKITLAVEMMNDFSKVLGLSLNDSSLKPARFEKIKLLCNEIHRLLEGKSPGETSNANNSSTQTVHLDVLDAEIQTDGVAPSGFRISSSASFKTLAPGVEVETQTDPFVCSNCNGAQRKPLEIQNDKYEFTQSLDNLQFDTQDVVKNSVKDKPGLIASRPRTQKPADQYEFTQSLDNIQINTCDILRGMNGTSVPLKDDDKQVNSMSQYKLNESLDGVNFNTEEIAPRQTQPDENLMTKNSAESCLKFTISTEAPELQEMKPVNKSMRTPNTSRKFKRIRTPPLSDSGSDSENPRKIAKQENGRVRMRNDLSINFISLSSSEDAPAEAPRKDDTFALSIGGSENIDYDEYLEKIMRKYDDEVPCSTPKRTRLKDEGHKRKASPERTDGNEPPAKIKHGENFSESLFSNGAENLLNAADEFQRHLRDPEESPKSDSNVVILQNILINSSSKGRSKLPYDLEEELAKMEENADKKSQNSDDMFASESEDLDVVETTPQKRSPARFATQSKIKERISFPPPDDPPTGVLSCLDVTLPPPIEFQDFDDNQDLENNPDSDVTLVSNVTAMDLEEDETLKKAPPNENVDSSPPPSEKLLHFSPIRPARKALNPVEMVSNSRFCPLEIVIKPEQRKVLATSTPRQKSILNYVRTPQQPDVSVYTVKSTQEKKPCIACTRLTKEQVIVISSLTNKKLATYSSSFHPGVTHMIVSTNEKNCLKDHTIKFVSAVASGIWVLGFNWVQECIDQNRTVEEEPFEVLDVSGIAGPRTARLTGAEKPLLKGFRIHAAPPFLSTTRKDIEGIVRMLGGEIVSAPEGLANRKGVRIIITEARATQDFELYETWLERFGVVTADLEWLSRSVGQYQLLSLRPFALCSDDTMANLGYPPELLVDTPFSFSQSMYSV